MAKLSTASKAIHFVPHWKWLKCQICCLLIPLFLTIMTQCCQRLYLHELHFHSRSWKEYFL